MRLNSRLLLVGVLVFIFPLLFVWITQNFFTTAYHNINTSEKKRVSLIQDSISVALRSSSEADKLVSDLIDVYKKENSDLTKIRVVEKIDDNFVIIQSADKQLVNTNEKTDQLYRSLPLSSNGSSLIVESIIDGERTWQVFRSVETLDDRSMYIFSEHRFGLIDSVMAARRQQSYFGLSAIFVFLILLAYWLNRQVHWKAGYDKMVLQLEDRDMFSNMIAHEFRSPLTAIKGYASFLEESKTLSKDEVRFASNIHKSAERLVVLVNDFLEVARLQSGKLKIEPSEVDMSDVLAGVTDDLRGMAEEKGLKLIFNRPEKKLMMFTDPARMIQVMTNIITNAIKYTDSGSVELECVKIPGEVTVRVKDTGTGISAEDQQKLFAPFTRVGGVDTSKITGTGLGMWITRQLVVLLGGNVGVESIKGVGTHVVITFRT
ncbi:HAMP domain-containing histidine kinase [Candidatus Nomurabacteria bacterium]|nr:HAMP domain-containing histidine kinase [Candidatus Nomurabacteria bacterium]